jgi:hypothetical protein
MQHLTCQDHSKRYLVALSLVLVLAATIISGYMLTTSPSAVYAKAPKLSIQFTCARAVDYKQGQICVHTQAKAALMIKVKYCSGSYATSRSLQGTQYANTKGNSSWSWVPQTKCRGTTTASVQEHFHGQFLDASIKFVVK